MTASFINGYRAFVLGGRRSRVIGRYRVEYFDGVEPFDDLTEKQKAEWRAGMKYAQREREECRSLWKKSKVNNTLAQREAVERKKAEARKLLKSGISRPVVARAVGLSYATVFYLEHERRN